MNETYSKSKLKRKKPSTGNMFHPETSSRDTQPRPLPLLSSYTTEETHGSLWWSREQLSAAESLWASTLKSALLHLEQQRWDVVPDLPLPSTVRPAAPQVDHQWCDLREEVVPLPEPAPPSPETLLLLSPDPLSVRSSQHDVPFQTRPAPHSSDTQPSTHHTNRQDGSPASLQAVTRTQQPSLYSWEDEAPSSAGPSWVRGGGEQKDAEAGPRVKRQLLTHQVKEKENKELVVKDEEEEEEQGRVRRDEGAAAAGGGGGERLQSCPMCLLVFPLGFTQMDCDGHLAQCLSEMNMDMTW